MRMLKNWRIYHYCKRFVLFFCFFMVTAVLNNGWKNTKNAVANIAKSIPPSLTTITAATVGDLFRILTEWSRNAAQSLAKWSFAFSDDMAQMTVGNVLHTTGNILVTPLKALWHTIASTIKALYSTLIQPVSSLNQSVTNTTIAIADMANKSLSTNPDAKPEAVQIKDIEIKPSSAAEQYWVFGKNYATDSKVSRFFKNTLNAPLNAALDLMRAPIESVWYFFGGVAWLCDSFTQFGKDIKNDWKETYASWSFRQKIKNTGSSLWETVKSVGALGKNVAWSAINTVVAPVVMPTINLVGRRRQRGIRSLFRTASRKDIEDVKLSRMGRYKAINDFFTRLPSWQLLNPASGWEWSAKPDTSPKSWSAEKNESDWDWAKKSWFGKQWDKVKWWFGGGKKKEGEKKGEEKKKEESEKEEPKKEERAKLSLAMITLWPNEYYAKRVSEIKQDKKIDYEIKNLIEMFEAHYHEHTRLYNQCKKAIEDKTWDVAVIEADIKEMQQHKQKTKDCYDQIIAKVDEMTKKDREEKNKLDDDLREKIKHLTDLERDIESKKKELEKIGDDKKKLLETDPAKSIKDKLDRLQKTFDEGKKVLWSLTDIAQQATKLWEVLGLGKTIKEQRVSLLDMLHKSPSSAPKDDAEKLDDPKKPKDNPTTIDRNGKKITRYWPWSYTDGDCGPAAIRNTAQILGISLKEKNLTEMREKISPWRPVADWMLNEPLAKYIASSFAYIQKETYEKWKIGDKNVDDSDKIISWWEGMKDGDVQLMNFDAHMTIILKKWDDYILIDPLKSEPKKLSMVIWKKCFWKIKPDYRLCFLLNHNLMVRLYTVRYIEPYGHSSKQPPLTITTLTSSQCFFSCDEYCHPTGMTLQIIPSLTIVLLRWCGGVWGVGCFGRGGRGWVVWYPWWWGGECQEYLPQARFLW